MIAVCRTQPIDSGLEWGIRPPGIDAAGKMVLDRCSEPVPFKLPPCLDVMPNLTINGAALTLDCPPDTPLLWAIRDWAGLAGTRPGCLVGLCGACTVHLDGCAVRPCSMSVAQAEGRVLTTIEGVLRTPLGQALHQAWAVGALHACEQCRAGRIMAAAALLARGAAPSDADVEAALGNHVCECGEPGDAGEVLRQVARSLVAGAEFGPTPEHDAELTVDATSVPAPSPKPERIKP